MLAVTRDLADCLFPVSDGASFRFVVAGTFDGATFSTAPPFFVAVFPAAEAFVDLSLDDAFHADTVLRAVGLIAATFAGLVAVFFVVGFVWLLIGLGPLRLCLPAAQSLG